MKSKLSPAARWTVLLASLAMLAVIFLPIWRIELSAPQYPEGLVLQIFSNRIGGDVDVVNGLNHYIGMHTLHTRDFIEFAVLPYIIGGFALLGFLAAALNRKRWVFGWAGLFLLIAVASMVDFYRWEYNYGHNLDAGAPIQVPGMAYQPPLLGYKQLLNFGAYSVPDFGGWVFVLVGAVLAVTVIAELRPITRRHHLPPVVAALVLMILGTCWSSCHSGPSPIILGEDHCEFCKMSFSNSHYGAEVCTRKGKVLKYDDIQCLLKALRGGTSPKQDIVGIYLLDYNTLAWISADKALLLHSDTFQTPMSGNTAAFADSLSRNSYFKYTGGEKLSWHDLYP